jgi:hypothetical protein
MNLQLYVVFGWKVVQNLRMKGQFKKFAEIKTCIKSIPGRGPPQQGEGGPEASRGQGRDEEAGDAAGLPGVYTFSQRFFNPHFFVKYFSSGADFFQPA